MAPDKQIRLIIIIIINAYYPRLSNIFAGMSFTTTAFSSFISDIANKIIAR